TTRTVYSPGGRVVATIDARGQRTDYAHDSAGRTVATTLPAVANGPGGPSVRPRIQNVPDALGLPVSVTDANGRVTAFQYDGGRRVTRTTESDGTFRTQTWDALGRRTGVTNEEGQVTTFAYDALGRLTAVSGLAGDATYAYDEAGNRVQQTDALGRVTRYRFDAVNRVVERTHPGGETERFAWDAVGNLVAATDGLGRVTALAYDAMNRVVGKTLPGGATVTYAYHPDGQRAAVTDARGTTSYAYDAAGRLRSVTHPTGDVVTYAHDANGNVTSIATPAAVVGYAYDALDRLVQVTGPEGTTSLAYDLVGNRLRRSAANGITTNAVFDARNRPTLLEHLAPGGARLLSYAMAYSPAGRRTAVTEADGSTEAYAYDARGRLASETRTGSHAYSATHTYDAVGNRTQSVRSGIPVAFVYDANDRLTSDGTSTYTWDANGNLATRSQSGSVTTYGFDTEHRLVTVAGAGVSRQFEYDADGHRVRSTAPSGTTRFLVDAMNPTGLAQVLEERDGNGSLLARYSYGDALIAQSRGATTSMLLQDALGSARALADAAGTITDRYTFDAFGTTVATSGVTLNPHLYRGERLDADTGLYHLRARYYSPAQGRFLSRDPLAGPLDDPTALHRYLYARGDPMNFADPTGMAEFSLPSLLTALTIVSLSADVVSFGATIVGAQDVAATAGTISLIASVLTIPVSAGKFALKKVAEESVEAFAQKYLKKAAVEATKEVLENRAKRLATKEAGSSLLKASADLGKQHIDHVLLNATDAALPELEQIAIGYVRNIVKETGPRLVAPMRDGLLFAFRQLPLSGRERAVANAMVKELDRLLSYAQKGLL
ncbi:MAG: hypothetical protein KJ018_00530, partial [Burkholderiales bacterium]|nr:hypothetical protein [Burkholderiales bacterium]